MSGLFDQVALRCTLFTDPDTPGEEAAAALDRLLFDAGPPPRTHSRIQYRPRRGGGRRLRGALLHGLGRVVCIALSMSRHQPVVVPQRWHCRRRRQPS